MLPLAGSWLRMLQLLLEPIGVPSNITVGGGLVRRQGQERIEHLAAVRNALLPPVAAGGSGSGSGSGSIRASSGGSKDGRFAGTPSGQGDTAAQYSAAAAQV